MATYVNLTCATAADCSSHSDRLVCTAHGVCGCTVGKPTFHLGMRQVVP